MNSRPWFKAPKSEVNKYVIDYVRGIERNQSDVFDRFLKLQYLYDPNSPSGTSDGLMENIKQVGVVQENAIASNVDTIAAVLAGSEIRARYMTDDADWSEQRKAKWLEWYTDGLLAKFEILTKCVFSTKYGTALKGNGINKVYYDSWKEIHVEPVQPDDIIVDDRECRRGSWTPQLHHRVKTSRNQLISAFPDNESDIETAQTTRDWNKWAGYMPLEVDEIITIESWYLPIGVKGRKGYVPGRHTIVIDNCDLVDEPYHKKHFPFAVNRWSDRPDSWYGIGLAERIIGHQRALNKRNWQIDRQLDNNAVPVTYVRLADANLAVKTINRVGTVVPYKADPPVTIIPPAVSPETYRSRIDIRESASEETGISRMAVHATKPAGIDSGVALREYKDQTTQRFTIQEKAFERFVLDTILLVLECCKELGDDAPVTVRRTKFGSRKIDWSDVDMGDVKIQIMAASSVTKTPAGRTQFVLELAQGGIISQDSARRLLDHPDIDAELSLYTAALEAIEEQIEQIADGNVVVPEAYDNLSMAVWRGQQKYLEWRSGGAPEDVLEGLRQYIVLAADMKAMQAQPAPEAMGATPQTQLAPEATGLV